MIGGATAAMAARHFARCQNVNKNDRWWRNVALAPLRGAVNHDFSAWRRPTRADVRMFCKNAATRSIVVDTSAPRRPNCRSAIFYNGCLLSITFYAWHSKLRFRSTQKHNRKKLLNLERLKTTKSTFSRQANPFFIETFD